MRVRAIKSTFVTNSIDFKANIKDKLVMFEENEMNHTCGCKQDIKCIIY